MLVSRHSVSNLFVWNQIQCSMGSERTADLENVRPRVREISFLLSSAHCYASQSSQFLLVLIKESFILTSLLLALPCPYQTSVLRKFKLPTEQFPILWQQKSVVRRIYTEKDWSIDGFRASEIVKHSVGQDSRCLDLASFAEADVQYTPVPTDHFDNKKCYHHFFFHVLKARAKYKIFV